MGPLPPFFHSLQRSAAANPRCTRFVGTAVSLRRPKGDRGSKKGGPRNSRAKILQRHAPKLARKADLRDLCCSLRILCNCIKRREYLANPCVCIERLAGQTNVSFSLGRASQPASLSLFQAPVKGLPFFFFSPAAETWRKEGPPSPSVSPLRTLTHYGSGGERGRQKDGQDSPNFSDKSWGKFVCVQGLVNLFPPPRRGNRMGEDMGDGFALHKKRWRSVFR